MKNPVLETKAQLRELLLSAAGQAVAEGALPAEPIPDFTIEIPADRKNGDFASNAAMVSAKAFHMPPRKIAEAIVGSLSLEGTAFARAEIAGPGFINFFLGSAWYGDVMQSVEAAGDDYGRTDYGAGKRVLVEFVSANPTGPMHIGNARGGALGDGIAAALEWAGYQASREFYLNDAGNQINKFALSLELRYLELYQDGIEMPEDSYKGQDITEHARNFAAIHGDAYVSAPSEERRKALVAYALPLNVQRLEDDLRKYRIEYDTWFRESTLHENGAVDGVIRLLKEKGCTYESEGALWFKATEFGADQDFVLVRSNGVPTYVVPDIAYHYNKLAVRGYDKAVDVLGADHHGYVPRLRASLQALGIDPSRLDAVIMQMVRLVRGTEIVKASKRSGTAITLATLIDEVPIDAARFYFNLREANSHFDFDLDLAVEESSQNPVYYVQYAHARICSIFRNLAAEGILPKPAAECDFSLLNAAEELALMQHIASLPNEIVEAAKAYDPTRITRYCLDLATLFHKFYNACRVKCDDQALMYARLCLCGAVKTTLHNAMSLLKITTPESM
jgi:arginyl-tRNA synthetase